MIRAPWWTWLIACGLGMLVTVLYLRTGSSAALDELRAQRDSAQARVVTAEAEKNAAVAIADSATEAHAVRIAEAESTIDRLTERVQASTARAADVGAEIRARVDEETAGLVTELEAEWQAVVESERAQAATWRNRALSAEAGWSDERLARVAAENQVEAMRATDRVQDGLIRALEAEVARSNRDKKIAVVAGLAGVAWGLTR